MHYYIDGYNLLFRLLKPGEEMRKQREQITADIEKIATTLQLDFTLVFDAYQEDEGSRSHYKSIEVIFTAKGESADDFILRSLKDCRHPSEHTVVTSDKKLAHLSKLRLGKTESVEEFLSWTAKRCKNKLKQRQKQQTTQVDVLLKPHFKPKEPEPAPLPKPQDSAEDCFNYYLEAFEKEVLQEPQPILSTKSGKKPRNEKLIKAKLKKEEPRLSDMERWQKAFENPDSSEREI